MSELFASFSVGALDAFFPASFCVARLGEVLDIRFYTERSATSLAKPFAF